MIRKVLLVADDPIFRTALKKRLTVLRRSSSIIFDLVMPRMDGMGLLSHIRENYSDLPAIIVSSMRVVEIQSIVKGKGTLACFAERLLQFVFIFRLKLCFFL